MVVSDGRYVTCSEFVELQSTGRLGTLLRLKSRWYLGSVAILSVALKLELLVELVKGVGGWQHGPLGGMPTLGSVNLDL